jgi:hypothetical protein
MRNERLSSNSRQSLGRGSNKSYAVNSKASWQYNFNKNTLSVSSCQSCSLVDCSTNNWSQNNTSSNGCQWQCEEYDHSYTYCNGIPPVII